MIRFVTSFALLAIATTCQAFTQTTKASSSNASRIVDLGYATYEGYYNDTFQLNIWKSVRYAAPPVGNRRWQAPSPALYDNDRITPAIAQPPLCPQSGAFGVPEIYGFNSALGNEDCLFLNIYAAPNATNLPVLVWFHGGGHSVFGALYDPSAWINTNSNGFIVVEVQYRLGAFGFLASPEVKKQGRLNAGLLDQRYSIEWTRQYIEKFGGDPDRITIGGESSGAASALFHAMAYGGKDTWLFENIIAASPYFPTVYKYSDRFPRIRYEKFVELAGCKSPKGYSTSFDCLVAADTTVLQNASGTVSTAVGYFGSFAFLPVIDDDYIQERPSIQLLHGKATGKRVLVGNNANDGVPLFNPNVSTKSQYDSFIAETFPLFTESDIARLNRIYQVNNQPIPDDGVVFDTLGSSGPTSLNQSGIATGIQQTVFDIAAETVFDCPAQWIAEAFSKGCKQAWKYQYSVTPSYHGADLSSYFSVGQSIPSADFQHAMQKSWGNFIIYNTPVISVSDAIGAYANGSVPVVGQSANIHWPSFSLKTPVQMNLNTTGGDVDLLTVTDELAYYVRSGPGQVNNFSLADAMTWEGGRGKRCDFWRSVSARVPQ
ncbi:alpha/beta-hydrolase [Xylariaceae sp. FL1272]|nr:alpha/beta-hydrolase [Xylariaceae sp. FL1272]